MTCCKLSAAPAGKASPIELIASGRANSGYGVDRVGGVLFHKWIAV